MGYRHGSFVWLEHLSHDGSRAQRFYEALFGWRTDVMAVGGNPPLPLIRANGHCIGSYREVASEAPVQWMPYLSVADVDMAFHDALAAGATSLMPPNDYAQAGSGAMLAGPDGARFVIWTSSRGDPPDAAQYAPGDWCWTELVTLDEQQSLAFFGRVFGFSNRSRETDAGGERYHVLMQGDRPRAGLRPAVAPQSVSIWLPHIRVVDCEAASRQAQSLGARAVGSTREVRAWAGPPC
jgi:predicted enzyme related to lactoylglutathione lyase